MKNVIGGAVQCNRESRKLCEKRSVAKQRKEESRRGGDWRDERRGERREETKREERHQRMSQGSHKGRQPGGGNRGLGRPVPLGTRRFGLGARVGSNYQITYARSYVRVGIRYVRTSPDNYAPICFMLGRNLRKQIL